MTRYLAAFPLIMHGLANISGVVAFLSNAQVGFLDHPWIFSQKVRMHSFIRKLFGLLWILSVIGLVASGLGITLHQDWRRTMASFLAPFQ